MPRIASVLLKQERSILLLLCCWLLKILDSNMLANMKPEMVVVMQSALHRQSKQGMLKVLQKGLLLVLLPVSKMFRMLTLVSSTWLSLQLFQAGH